MIGMLATSKAGHDCKEVFVIVREEEEYVYLADGRLKPVDAPKKKKKKHIQIIKKTNPNIYSAIEENREISNEEVKRAIKEYEHRSI